MSGVPFEEEDEDEIVVVTPIAQGVPQPQEPDAEGEDPSIEDILDLMQSLGLAVCVNSECGWRGPWWRLKDRNCPTCGQMSASLFEIEDMSEDDGDPNG